MRIKIFLAFTFFFIGFHSKANVSLGSLFTNNMVLQRNIDVKIWGTAEVGEQIVLKFNGQEVNTKANCEGKWMLVLKPMKAGGPFTMVVKGTNKIILNNILIGDVWICSGQSNMQMKVSETTNADQEIKNANYPNIRLFTVPKKVSNIPLNDLSKTSWKTCSPQTIHTFSATAYYFARDLQKEIGVPIGLIHSSWGGTCAETWTSKESIVKLPNYENFGERIDKYDVKGKEERNRKELKNAIGVFSKVEHGLKEKWMHPNFNRSDWKPIKVPSYWENAGFPFLNGVVWYSYNFEVNSKQVDGEALLHLGKIDDSDITWVNGQKVGERKWGANQERVYPVASSIFKKGSNNITVRVKDSYNKGGFSSKPEKLFLKIGNEKINLSGTWKFKADKVILDLKPKPNDVPSLLYNAMIHPIINYGIKGVIWYQGESNARRAKEYATTFPNLITNWREAWQQDDFPFLFVQLANFKRPSKNPKDDDWAELRESQSKTLALKNTGMAVAIDIGMANNIHPVNKQDVGNRLMHSALKVAYGKNNVHSGPLFKSLEIKNNTAVLSFDFVGSGLKIQGDSNELQEFEIAGADKKFYWAKAKIKGNKIVVWAEEVQNPVAVRFAWSSNPSKFNLYNKEGLPASPFRTDNWQGVTDGKSFDN